MPERKQKSSTTELLERAVVALEGIWATLGDQPTAMATEDDVAVSRKLMAMTLLADGKTVAEIAEYLGVNRATVYRWNSIRKAKGLDDYRDRSLDNDGEYWE